MMSPNAANTRLAMNDFFMQVQNKALRQAEIAVGDRDEALDILQHAMMKLASCYSHKQQLWPQLFQRILQNAIRDWYRRQQTRRLFFWQHDHKHSTHETDNANEQLDTVATTATPESSLLSQQRLTKIEHALGLLPQRQQQAFILRAWWGHSTQETAFAMKCSEGSVKTHYSRALAKLKLQLEDLQ